VAGYSPSTPVGDLVDPLRQPQPLTLLQLRKAVAVAVVDHCCAQRSIAVQAPEQLAGCLGRGQGAAAQLLGGEEFAKRVHGLRGDALPRDPVGGTDEGEVGYQQHGGEQDEQGEQQLAADREIFEALTQLHGTGTAWRRVSAG